MSIQAPYGSWRSPITPDLIAAHTIRFGDLALAGDTLYWLETRPAEGGRTVLLRRSHTGTPEVLTPPPYNVRTRVHEYGGGAFLVASEAVYFSHFPDQRLYRLVPGKEPSPITPPQPLFYADGIFDPYRQRILCVREDHSLSQAEPKNAIVGLSLTAGARDHAGDLLIEGHDFYAAPRLSPDGRYLAWLAWNHPAMPWDGTELWMAEVQPDGTLRSPRKIAGGLDESIFQPEWSPSGILHFVSDRTGWWNLYRFQAEHSEALCPMEAEFGQPQWVFGLSTYAFESATSLICLYTQRGIWHLARLNTETGRLTTFDLPYTDLSRVKVGNGRVYCLASSPLDPPALIQIDLATLQPQTLRSSTTVPLDRRYFSLPQPLEYPTEGNGTAYGFFYPPHNPDFHPPPGAVPPLLVKVHGGPTGATTTAFNLLIQFWTSRGFAVVDVNYGGSTGYGRAYRERLNGQWGIVDVGDCVNAVRHLVDQGLVDHQRVVITGGSAGGYTTLCALTFRDCFTAGSSYYGVSDLEALTKETHKFESHYLDTLVGPYPQCRELYRQRSPLHAIDQLSRPLILFQGLEDPVVPPNQAERLFEALRAKGIPVALLVFPGEQHGFRRADTMKRVLEAELFFYGRLLNFTPADSIPSIEIANLPSNRE
ncbi:MAG: S9 family peptidase [Nitrospirae bacterium]|nr:MAG: S9 family peptidase [Nitrospirota bacterium]